MLTEFCTPYKEEELSDGLGVAKDLHDTLLDLRTKKGFGRGIAAPQIGVNKRLVVLQLEKPLYLFNPELHDLSPETFELWDDCFSFPDLLVRVRRHRSLRLPYRDHKWREQSLNAHGAVSELLQHEVDHLDGILATARAVDAKAFALKSQRHLIELP